MKYQQIYKEDGDCGYRIYQSLIISPWTDVFHSRFWRSEVRHSSSLRRCLSVRIWMNFLLVSSQLQWWGPLYFFLCQSSCSPIQATDNTEVGVNGCYGRCQGWYPTSSWAHYPSGWQPVHGYIKNEKTFVANRVATIHERSECTQWHHVPSKLNPADIASRGLDASSLVENKEWKNGPEFLWQLEQCWPHQPRSHPVSEEDPDVKNSVICTTSMKKEANDIVTRILTWFSDWFRLRRFVALFHRTVKGFQHVLSRTSTFPDPRTISSCVSNISEADKIIVRWVQNRSFPEEISWLQSGEDSFLPRSNRLVPLNPILVDGILRVGGRIKNTPVTDDTKHSVIFPADYPVSSLILQKIHVETGHGGRDQVPSWLHQRYWVIHATSVCRQICKFCVLCHRHFGRTVQQQMADLPADRVTPDQKSTCRPVQSYSEPGNGAYSKVLWQKWIIWVPRCQKMKLKENHSCMINPN